MKFTLALFATSLAFFISLSSPAQSRQDSLALEKIILDETLAWNKGDAKAYSEHFAEDGTFTNVLGLFYKGYEEFLLRHDFIFKGVFKGTTMTQNIVSMQFINQDVAILETLIWVSGMSSPIPFEGVAPDEQGRLRTRLLQILKKEDGEWKIRSYHNVDIEKGVPSPEPR
ncbi:SgcJ/EcaC family oxidoreductase [Jiulongibacter sediminis]|jgi:uncharacterized protein (TIGR02246 family)|uniref:SgcJ/EcaC family oxidoreductase n=1 Tax=Jiulongibacter sediminis TaxID=1605367 RepID=UPI0026EF8A72|nr:SgcJ/EcaC family oxidoreductase [Jiulongibacter sediminis]